ncbi:sensor histidine kinase [Anaerorhabdus sp.]|nr:sensor histidine kinase [Anaerorhabdus sp.]MEA4874797.1 sensor histidine kinase [Anaerorhabdus sp.]
MKTYLKDKIKSIGISLGCLLIQTIVLFLFGLDLFVVGYAFLLCLIFIVISFLVDYAYYRRKRIKLQELIGKQGLEIEEFPKNKDPFEKEYQEIIELLIKEKNELEYVLSNSITDSNDYFTMWVHQIKTPIAAMRLLLQTSDQVDKQELEEQLFKIEQYVDMVLQYIRMKESNRDFLFETIECDQIIKQSVRKYAKSFIRKKINLNYEPVNFSIITDEKWLCFVVEQLLSNAIKYTPEGGTITITHEWKVLIIKDTGIGISKEDIPRIFEKGFTGYNGRIDKKSTGIGLFLCKTVCDKLGHTIKIDSSVKEGTIVKIGLDSYLTK